MRKMSPCGRWPRATAAPVAPGSRVARHPDPRRRGSPMQVSSGAPGVAVKHPRIGVQPSTADRRERQVGIEVATHLSGRRPVRRGVHQCLGQAHRIRSEEHTSELQSLMRISYAVFCLKKTKKKTTNIENDKNIPN